MSTEPLAPTPDPGALSKIRWSRDNAGLPALVERLVRRSLALTDEQVAAIRAALTARQAARETAGGAEMTKAGRRYSPGLTNDLPSSRGPCSPSRPTAPTRTELAYVTEFQDATVSNVRVRLPLRAAAVV